MDLIALFRSLDVQVQAAIIGGVVGAVIGGCFALLGGIVQAWTEEYRTNKEKKAVWLKTTLEWHDSGGVDSLRRAVLSGTNLADVRLSLYMKDGSPFGYIRGADLSASDLRRAVLISADLAGANLKMADLSRADLRNASLVRANLLNCKLSKANLCGANLESVENLQIAQIRDAKYDQETRWPAGFTPPKRK